MFVRQFPWAKDTGLKCGCGPRGWSGYASGQMHQRRRLQDTDAQKQKPERDAVSKETMKRNPGKTVVFDVGKVWGKHLPDCL